MLTRLSVKGFKSFADPTTLRLRAGVNVIVGPNGSGKSNLAEAILWALGEQRAGRLRAGGMGDVLYAGGEDRSGAGSAEVTLVLGADEDSAHPAEIEASRRLTRAGDALYRLGGAAVRLLDLQEALASRGLGPDALAVIRQGQVEALCTSTPEQRRAMVDAAAGVAVAKRRRRRAEQKLARVDDRLLRARDLAGEVATRGQAMVRQARAAERAAELDAQIARGEARVAGARARAAADALAAARQTEDQARAGAGAAEEAARAAGAKRDVAEAAHAEAQATVEAAREHAGALREAHQRVRGLVELSAERVAGARRRAERALARREGARERRGAAEAAAARTGEALASALVDRDEAAAAASGADEVVQRTRSEHRASRDAQTAAVSAHEEARRRLAEAERVAERTAGELERARAAVAAHADAGPPAGALERAERRREIGEGRAERWSRRLAEAERVAADADAVRAGAEEALRTARAGARALASGAERSGDGPSRLGDGIEVEPGAERAVAAALGARVDAVVVEDLAAARAALDGGASAALLPVAADGEAEAGAQGDDVPARASGDARPVWDLVRTCPGPVRATLRRLLADCWLVEDLAQPPPGPRGTLVDRAGVALRPADGLVSRADEAWTRRALHRRAVEAEERAAAQAAEVAARADSARALAQDAGRRLRAAERARARAAAAVADLRGASERAAAARAGAAAELARLEAGAEGLASARDVARSEVDDAAARAHETTAAEAEAGEAARRAADEGRVRQEAASAAAARAAAAAAARAEAEARLAAIAADADAADPDPAPLDLADRAVAALEALAAALGPAAADAAAARDGLVRGMASGEAAVGTARAEVRRLDAVAAEAREAVHRAEVEVAVAAERAAEAGPPPAADDEEVDPEAVAAELEALRRRRASIGAVNPLAAQEQQELAEREADMQAQIADLEATAERLRAHMTELDQAVAAGFDSLFRSLCDRFEEVCGLLFPGGRGRLSAVLDEDGEPGIEVEVVPAGKRPRPLSLLSGGERSLVALAFCLALAMARPAPFYLLDEVEAALDDVNLRRFLSVVRRLADGGRQFLLITHQQPTVEIADTLFGVTMAGEGVSQVLARRLDRPADDRQEAPPARLRAIPGGRGA